MPDNHLHIVSFNVPYPPNYGGVIDVYYRIKSLAQSGIKIYLHCFTYGRKEAPVLNEWCEEVNYYKRDTISITGLSRLPYIVASRRSDHLLARLKQDNYPILFDGLHTCFYLDHPALAGRKKIVRSHNIEWQYYRHLSKSERSLFRKIYFLVESWRLKRFEKKLQHAQIVLAVTPADQAYYKKLNSRTEYLPSFHQYEAINIDAGSGTYALYHGNLSVAENIQAVEYLARDIIPGSAIRLVVAGLEPPASLTHLIANIQEIELHANPSDEEMNTLIAGAQVIVLPTFQATGLKLKLLHSLYRGRHCLVNREMVAGSGLEDVCHVANDSIQMRKMLSELMQKPFGPEDIAVRSGLLEDRFSNENKSARFVSFVFND